jgi:CspA family cold shock protein
LITGAGASGSGFDVPRRIEIHGKEKESMSNGTVRWFNQTIGAGFIRTDDGESVMFLHIAVKKSDPSLIREGARVSLDVVENKYGLTAINVKAA